MAIGKSLSTSSLSFAGFAALAALAVGLTALPSSETVLRNSFSIALEAAPAVREQIAKAPPVAGSEDFWLMSMRTPNGLPATKTVAVGDRIALTVGGQDRKLEVAAVSEFAPKVTEIDTRASTNHFVLITARDTASKDSRSIRFVMEVEQTPAAAIPAQAARTL
jgi:hypothetical protein